MVWISEQTGSGAVGTKLTNNTIGVLCEEGYLNDALSVSTTNGTSATAQFINMVDTSHQRQNDHRLDGAAHAQKQLTDGGNGPRLRD